jgi:hypothetical protein
VTDDRPRVESVTRVRPGEVSRVLPRVLALGTDLPLRDADEAFRDGDGHGARASPRLLQGGAPRVQWRPRLVGARERALSEDGDNPCCRWIAGGRGSDEVRDRGHRLRPGGRLEDTKQSARVPWTGFRMHGLREAD